MTITSNNSSADGDGPLNNGRRVLGSKSESSANVKNNESYNSRMHRYPRPYADKAAVQNVRRVLFGPPADPEETRVWLQQKLLTVAAEKSKQYNFDFFNGTPMAVRPSNRYVWESLMVPKIAEEEVKEDEESSGCSRTTRVGVGKIVQAKVTDYIKSVKRKTDEPAGAGPSSDTYKTNENDKNADTIIKRLRYFAKSNDKVQEGI